MSEEQEQKALVKWFKLQYPQYQNLITLPSFGENIGAVRMKNLKAMGLTPGWPDIFIAVPKERVTEVLMYGQYGPRRVEERYWSHGLFVEMKTKNGKASKSQNEMIDELVKAGYYCALCHGWDEAREVIKRYLDE